MAAKGWRPVDWAKVSMYTESLRNGQWRLTAETIKMPEDDE